MQGEHAHTIKLDRPLTGQERELLQWLLEHGSSNPDEKAQFPFVTVVGRCDCGCCTIELAVSGNQAFIGATSTIIADFVGRTPEGVFVGIMLHVREGLLSELEVYSLDDAATFSLPLPATLKPFGSGESA